MKSNKIAKYGLLIALAMILSYVEALFPIPIPINGIKIGLANLVVITALYGMGNKEALVISIIRVILVGFTFGNLSTMLYSLAGGLLSLLMMMICKRSKLFGMIGVSVVGGIFHNIGQIMVAMMIVENTSIIYFYLPFLLIAGMIAGIIIGILGGMILKRLNNFFDY